MKDQERLDLIDEYKAAIVNLTAGLNADGSESKPKKRDPDPKA